MHFSNISAWQDILDCVSFNADTTDQYSSSSVPCVLCSMLHHEVPVFP